MKLLKQLALLLTILGAVQAQGFGGEDEYIGKETPPPPCPSNEITDKVCSRKIQTTQLQSLTYWVTMEDQIIKMNTWEWEQEKDPKTGEITQVKREIVKPLQLKVPYLHGHMYLEANRKLDGKSSYSELRLCIEITLEGMEYEWREQLMFHSMVLDKTFSKQIKSLDKGFNPLLLKTPTNFCSTNDDNPYMLSYSEVTIEEVSYAEDSKKKEVFVDFKRPLKEFSEMSMDMEPGQSYQVFLSWYLYKNSKQSKSSSRYTYGDAVSGRPKFETMYLQIIEVPLADIIVNKYEVAAQAIKGAQCIQFVLLVLVSYGLSIM